MKKSCAVRYDKSRLTEYPRRFTPRYSTCLKYIEVRSLPGIVLSLASLESFRAVSSLRIVGNFVDRNTAEL